MKVILVNPPYGILPTGDKIPQPEGSFPPLGLAYVAAVLEQNGVDVKIVDADTLNLNIEETVKLVEKEKPDIVGLTSVTPTINTALKILRQIKEKYPDIITVIGGVHAHFAWAQILTNEFVDFCVIGEGEYPMLNLIRALESNKKFNEMKGLAFRENGRILTTGSSPRIINLDELPFPARHLLPMDKYTAPFLIKVKGRPYTTLMTSRGCPFGCNFCASSAKWERKVTFISPEKVVDEIIEVVDKFKVKYLQFWDDTFTADKKRVNKICDGIIQHGLEIDWGCNIRCNPPVGEELLKKMKKAGCKGIYIGIEFGNQKILDFANKRITLDMVRNTVNTINKVGGFKTQGFFMIGYPTETRETINDTINLTKNLDLTTVAFSITVPYPGTEIYNYCRSNNLLIHEEWNKYSPKKGNVFIKLEDVNEEELSELFVKAYRDFYYRPSYILRSLTKIRSFEDLRFYVAKAMEMVI